MKAFLKLLIDFNEIIYLSSYIFKFIKQACGQFKSL